MQNTKRLSELLSAPGKRLGSLKQRSQERSSTLSQVRSTLSLKLAEAVISAGIEGDVLTVGVKSAAWASRLRYLTKTLRDGVTADSGSEISRVRIRVVPPGT
jgi:predicted nucleic acid-binding Zn ribbon protein